MRGINLASSSEEAQNLKNVSSGFFHKALRVLPERQKLVTVPPDTRVAEAMSLMIKHGFSQLPVIEGQTVLGVFSFRSLARHSTKINKGKSDLNGLPVDDFVDTIPFVSFQDEFNILLEKVDKFGAVLVGTESRLQGIITASDVMTYFKEITTPYLLLYEIELGLREIIRLSISEECLKTLAMSSLKEKYKTSEKIPARTEDMEFSDYPIIIGRNWDHFCWAFAGDRGRAVARVNDVREIRNDVFHFKKEISIQQLETLADNRDWILRRIKCAHEKVTGGSL